MKKIFLTVLVSGIAITSFAQTKKPVAKTTVSSAPAVANLTSTLDSASYAFGISMASSLKNSGMNSLNYELLTLGMKDTFAGQNALLSNEAAETAIGNIFRSLTKAKYAASIAEGKEFLENNKTKPGVKTTASGLQYIVINQGNGIQPKGSDSVLVHYKGNLLNGKQFDSSYDRGQPHTLTLDRVIPGWMEGMKLMSTGSKFKFFIPYQLAYGESGAGRDIPPYSTLIFEIELLKVNGK